MPASAHAKLNLHLAVLAREDTGYHQIETVFCAVDLSDDVEITSAGAGIELEVSGADLGPTHDNYAYRAAAAFFEQARLPPSARIRITKRIPAGAGLGGGSSDAAATLAALNELHGFPLGAATLREIGFSIGSDVPFFLSGHAFALAWGRGQRVLALKPPPPTPVLLFVPMAEVATRDAYEALAARRGAHAQPTPPRVYPMADLTTPETIAATAYNDFEDVVFDRMPELRAVKLHLLEAGAFHALLTGTGSVVFGMFRNTVALEAAAARLDAAFPHARTIVTKTRERL